MEQHLPIVAKKFRSIVRVIYYMLRKGMLISKPKILADLNLILKRGKIAGKAAIHSLMMFHHHSPDRHLSIPVTPSNEYEFSCSSSPAAFFHLPFHLSKRGAKRSSHAPQPIDVNLVAAALEMIVGSAAASPALPGFGVTPMVRQLRITDSPFPLGDDDHEGGGRVDEAAEEFIMRFYKDLRRQNEMGSLGYS